MGQNLKLMIPGPVEVDPAVLQAMGSPVQPHYGDVWTAFYQETIELLKKVLNTAGDVYLMPGSGTTAIDACLGSAFATGEKILVGNNGFFGDRLVSIAECYGLKIIPVKVEWGSILTPDLFERAFQEHPDAKGVAIVHLETSTTILNPIDQIGPLVREKGAYFFVDAVSSLGGVPFHMDDWCLDFCASATQKCLGAPPGLAPCAVGKRGWEAVDRLDFQPHGWFCNLRTWRKYATEWGDWHPTPVTMSSNNVQALKIGLEQLMAEGIETRLERYRGLALRLREGLRRLGFKLYTPDEIMSPVLTAAWSPEGIPSSKLLSHLANNYQIKISTGLGALKEKIFRIGTMSPVISEKDIDEVLEALGNF